MGSDKKQQKVQSSGFTKEEELLLQDFSRNVSTKSSALFYGNAFIVSAVPICKYDTSIDRMLWCLVLQFWIFVFRALLACTQYGIASKCHLLHPYDCC